MRWQSELNQKQLKIDCKSILSFYQEKGYVDAGCEYQIEQDSLKNLFNLKFIIVEGEVYHFGDIDISGLDKVNKNYVLQIINFKSGDIFLKKSIIKSQLRALSTGLFKDFQVTASEIHFDKRIIDVMIKIKEQSKFSIDLGTGINTEDGWNIFSEWKNRNLNGWGRSITINNYLSVDYSNVIYFKKGKGSINYTEPLLLNFPVNGQLELSYITDKPKYVNFGFERYGVLVIIDYPFSLIYSAYFKFKWQKDRLFDVPFDTDSRNFDKLFRKDNNRIFSFDFIRDTRDNMIDASVGSYLVFTSEKAGGFLGGDNSYYKFYFLYNMYIALYRKMILANKITIGIIELLDNSAILPSYLRFFLGGTGSVRGYSERSLGPKNPMDGSSLGGNFLFIYNLELRYYINYNISIIGFLDIGELSKESSNAKFRSLYYSAGPGIRVRTKFGIFRVDYGFKLNNFSFNDLGKIHIAFGQSF
jgi:outer membrane protein insertion porin family